MVKYRFILNFHSFFAILLFGFLSHSFCQNEFTGNLNTDSKVVSDLTIVSFQFFLKTQKITTGDQIVLTLPNDVQFSPSLSQCSISSASYVCVFSTQSVTINFGSNTLISSLEGQITNFKNPDSVRTISGIIIKLFSADLSLKAQTSLILSDFTQSSLAISLTSSSQVVGDTNAKLTIAITPSTVLKQTGKIILQIPEYYQNSGSANTMLDTTPSCAGNNLQTIDCNFAQFSRQLSINYVRKGGDANSQTTVVFTVEKFKNPITPLVKSGFEIYTFDSNNFPIGKALNQQLPGVTQPAAFYYYNLTFAEPRYIGSFYDSTLRIQLNIPVEQQCYLRIIFPLEINAMDQLTSLKGSGFFSNAPLQASIDVLWITKDQSTNSIDIQACYSTQTNPYGELVFSKLKTPSYAKSTSSIQILVSKDQLFSQILTKVTSNFVIQDSYLRPGTINSIKVTPLSLIVQEKTGYKIDFTPTHDLVFSTKTQISITVEFPSSITLATTSCSVTNQNDFFNSASIGCAVSGQKFTITSPFSSTYQANNQLSIVLNNGYNSVSEQEISGFKVTTYVIENGISYKVDEGTDNQVQFKMKGGLIAKQNGLEIGSSSEITYDTNVKYTFYIKMQHIIPQNGYILITLPSEIQIANQQMVSQNCLSSTSVSMPCTIPAFNQILVQLTTPAFQNGYSNIQQALSFSIQGFRNPRSTDTTSTFVFQSLDSQFLSIDKSQNTDFFTVKVNSFSTLNSFKVEILNQTNGALSEYIVTVDTNVPIKNGDQLQIQFPPEVSLSSSFSCSPGSSNPTIQSVSCKKIGNLLTANLDSVGTINENQQFKFSVLNVVNPSSTKPSSAFSNVRLFNKNNAKIAEYSKNDVIVQTSFASFINVRKLTQSNKNPQDLAQFNIAFQTNNPIPPTGTILITTPDIITLQPNMSCVVFLTQQLDNFCSIDQKLIKIEGAFSYLKGNYIGEVSISFFATNPADNTNLSSIMLRVFTDNTYQYRIDKIENGLTPALQCNFPCKLCAQVMPDYCTDCFENDQSLPSLIQFVPAQNSQTCVFQCSPGFTTNGSRFPKTCRKCDSMCKTCEDNFQIGDVSKCVTCDRSSPLFYKPTKECWKECKPGTYQCNRYECCDCELPCKTCRDTNICYSCYQDSNLNLLSFNQCVGECREGYVAQGQFCVQCQSPCATCDTSPNSCLTCDNLSENQFLFGRQCVSQCPNGTVLDLNNRTCIGCEQGCLICDYNNNSQCLACNEGLALFNNTCLTDCPYNFVKSQDGSICEVAPYLLDGYIIYFPFTITALIMIGVSVMSYTFTKGESYLTSNAIALISLIEVGSLWYLAYDAYKREYHGLFAAGLAIYGIHMQLNIVFLVFYYKILRVSDPFYYQWKRRHWIVVAIVLLFCTIVSCKMIRLIYGRLF